MSLFANIKRKRLVLVGVILTFVLAASAAFAYWTSSGEGSGEAKANYASATFEVSSAAVEGLYPGANPVVTVKVKDKDGNLANWKFEGYPPSVLYRTGWKREVTLKPGDTITVFGWRARDGTNWAHSREVTFADGKKLFFGPPSGTGDGGNTPPVAVP